ncbi:MAG: hypothetical protein ABI451_10805 [Dokdonella sp.]
MKPDLGLQLLRDGIDQDIALHFYGVIFHRIDFLAPNSCSIRVERNHFGIIHVAMFEFDDEIMISLLSRVPAAERARFDTQTTNERFPFSECLPGPIKVVSIECRIGTVQHRANESFVPIRILGVE